MNFYSSSVKMMALISSPRTMGITEMPSIIFKRILRPEKGKAGEI
jgi:hypothetical protein